MFIWGTKGSVQKIGYLIQECPSCESGPFAVHQAKKKFTLYFIPTFSYSNKQYLECLSCHDSFEVPSEMKPSIERNLLTQAEFSTLAGNKFLAEPDSRGGNLGGEKVILRILGGAMPPLPPL